MTFGMARESPCLLISNDIHAAAPELSGDANEISST